MGFIFTGKGLGPVKRLMVEVSFVLFGCNVES